MPSHGDFFRVADILKSRGLHTVCESARCPNIGTCWTDRTATFLILGDVCTRNCGFCAVSYGRPGPPDPAEPSLVAEAVVAMGLKFAVVTSVTRDDLEDGGASHFARTVREIRDKSPGTKVEALIPDFGGDAKALAAVLESNPDVLGHNLETVESLYPFIGRPRDVYPRALGVLRSAKEAGARTKSGLMVGLGEARADLLRALEDLRRARCDLLTVGQYLRATPANPPVARYYAPEEFEEIRAAALDLGFLEVAAAPLVRSSFGAERLYETAAKGV